MVYSKPECFSVIGNLEIKPGNIIMQNGIVFLIKGIYPMPVKITPEAYKVSLFCENVVTDKLTTILYDEAIVVV
jgi:hypothetical protein